ncbi:uncharacterized protein LOC108164289 [Drosophila miranda]|uniref:uncharacterized protein LOC108164289 n=1 Tax=Drosophila miranda TaxID=7229 RepID=UPI0007E801B7|nr:uncharacterized protein LOC108164289 [Drosophila miranda]
MQNLIESPALLSILKEPRRNCGEIQGESVAEPRSDVVKSVAGGGAPLNANARVFVPRSVATKAQEVDAPMDLNELKRHFELKDEKRKKTVLVLPWHGFPKRPEKSANPSHVTLMANEDHAYEIKLGGKRARLANACAEEKRLKTNQKSAEDGLSLPVDLTLEEKRKVALEALKLMEQRRLRDPSFGPFKKTEAEGVIRHISRSPVRFTTDERERVSKMRVDKKERIEKVLMEMLQKKKPLKLYPEKWQKEARVQEDGEQQTCQVQKPSKANHEKQSKPAVEVPQEQQQGKPPQQRMIQKRYFGLQRATTINAQAETELEPQPQVQNEPPAEAKQQPPRRYIPTTKEWDEKCRTRELERERASNKENEKSKSSQKPSVTANKPVLWRADTSRPLTVSNSAKDSPEVIKLENPTLAPVIPRYVPPIPVADPAYLALTPLLHSEKRRGNLTYAQALLKRPPGKVDGSTNPPLNNVVRYSVKELLMLEPQPDQLLAPILPGTSKGLGCLLE